MTDLTRINQMFHLQKAEVKFSHTRIFLRNISLTLLSLGKINKVDNELLLVFQALLDDAMIAYIGSSFGTCPHFTASLSGIVEMAMDQDDFGIPWLKPNRLTGSDFSDDKTLLEPSLKRRKKWQ
ncbi:hypothetical protein CHS0354_028221 [Potamilus streckersoni]|uniref:Uncharacterized protein n=1 Tax=Potamilus streckersoni TaxID=2493646 RepID=A0AAE0RTV5_9BIVA|nr:hypothetical protein CHS0354_028221 [Potamilus streckersoni]